MQSAILFLSELLRPHFPVLPLSSTHLSTVCDVDDDVGFLVEDSLAQGGEVRRVVGVAAVRLDDGEGDGLTRGEDDLTAFVQLQKA